MKYGTIKVHNTDLIAPKFDEDALEHRINRIYDCRVGLISSNSDSYLV